MSQGIPRTAAILTPSGTPTSDATMVVAATSSPGDLFHTAAPGTDDLDLLWMWATNPHTGSLILNLEVDGNPRGKFNLPRLIAPALILDGFPINGAKIIRVWCATTAQIIVSGRVYNYEQGAVA